MSRSRAKESQHHHGCIDCNRRYVCGRADCTEARRCNVCVSGRVTEAARAWEPASCCYATAPLPIIRTAKEREPYKLFGQPWFKCRVCARQFPCQPQQVRTP